MSTIIVASSEPRVGRSLIAAAVAYRMGRAGTPVTLARLGSDESAAADAATFAMLEGIISPGQPVVEDAVASMTGDVVIEAAAGPVRELAVRLHARVIVVGGARSAETDAANDSIAARIVTRVAPADLASVGARAGVAAVLAEDRVLAAPSVADIAKTLDATWLAGEAGGHSVGRVMLGTVASDAASPYFANRESTCVITRFDKTDIQLAALQTDLECMVITGGREPSPYLLDRVRGSRDDVALLLTSGSTVESMNAIESLYATSRFDGATKLERAVGLLDAAGVPVEF
jgi:BioD-like phosphotransacetylase family protein